MKITNQLACRLGEYQRVLQRAGYGGWLSSLIEAHATAIDQVEASYLLSQLRDLPEGLDVHFKGKHHGFASYKAQPERYGIRLPGCSGTGACRLRVGVVLHEAAHILCYQKFGGVRDKFTGKRLGHGFEFCRMLRALIETFPWRHELMRTVNTQRQIFERHRGPYTLVLTRESPKGQFTDKLDGPFSAIEAHETAKKLVEDARDTVLEVFVYSDTEGQFIGAFYKYGVKYASWEEMEHAERMELPTPIRAAALVPERPVAVPTLVPAGDERVQAEPVAASVSLPTVPLEKKSRRVYRRGARYTLATKDGWPTNQAAQLVFLALEQQPYTVRELTDLLGDGLRGIGVEHPASLVSRLKTAGLVKEIES